MTRRRRPEQKQTGIKKSQSTTQLLTHKYTTKANTTSGQTVADAFEVIFIDDFVVFVI